jgi:hypothetical protein
MESSCFDSTAMLSVLETLGIQQSRMLRGKRTLSLETTFLHGGLFPPRFKTRSRLARSDRQPIAQQMPALFDREKCPGTSFLESTALRNCRCVLSCICPVRIEFGVQDIWELAGRVCRGTIAPDV